MEIYQWSLVSLIGFFILGLHFYIFNRTAKLSKNHHHGQATLFLGWIPAFVAGLIFERFFYRTYIFTELSWFSIVFAIIPFTIVIFKLLYKVYCACDKFYLYDDAESNLFHYILLYSGIAVMALGNSFTCFDFFNYYFSVGKEYKYVEINRVYDIHHKDKYEDYYTYHAVLAKPMFGMKDFRIQKEEFKKYQEDSWLKIIIYRGALGAPFVYSKYSSFVAPSEVPEELIAQSEAIKKKYEPSKIKFDGLDRNVPMNGY